MRGHRGVSRVETLIGILIVAIASIGTLTYFSSALGNVNKQGNRRAALERARERLELLMSSPVTPMTPPQDGQAYAVTCTVGTCTWSLTPVPETVTVEDQPNRPIISTVLWVDDPSIATATLDTLALDVKVWFHTTDVTFDDAY